MVSTIKRTGLLFFLGTCTFGGGLVAMLVTSRLNGPVWAQSSPASTGGGLDLLRTSERFETVARKVSPAVVAVEASKPPSLKQTKQVEESGSGVLVRLEGQSALFVLTNNHVIAPASAAQITVSLADDRIVKPVQVLSDPESDVALLRLDDLEGVTAATLGDSDSVRVGQWVLALGSPFGLNQTVTHGIISAKERGQVSLGSTIRIKDFLQTDAAINPGSSGGPLVNLEGEIIGINTAIASSSGHNSGVAFSIPINLVKRVIKQLLEKGSVARGYLGMQLASTFEPGDALRLGLERAQGAFVEAVYQETPAATAGLRAQDVVLKMDGTIIRNENHLINLVTATPAGQKIRLEVWRNRKSISLEAVVGDWARGQARFRPVP